MKTKTIIVMISSIIIISNYLFVVQGHSTNDQKIFFDIVKEDFFKNGNMMSQMDAFYSNKNGSMRINSKNIITETYGKNIGDTIKPGWPVELDDHHGSVYAFDSSITCADLDEDGDLEVLIHSGEGSVNGKVYVFHHNGSPVNGWPIYTGSQGISTPAVGDIDPEYPGLEVVVSMNAFPSSTWNMYAWHADGTPMNGWPIRAGQSFCSPSIADIDNDGMLEIIQVIDNPGGEEWRNCQLFVWNGDGTDIPGFPITFVSPPDEDISGTSTAIGDVDADTNLEIVFGLSNKKIYVYRNNGTLLKGWPVSLDEAENIVSTPVLGDVDNDEDLEIIGGSSGDINNVHIWHHNGSYLEGWPKTVTWISDQSPSLCDLDKNRKLEIVMNYGIGSHDHDEIVIWNYNGSLYDGWPQYSTCSIKGSPITGYADGDSNSEIFFIGPGGVYGWHQNGEVIQNFPKINLGRFDGTAAVIDLENNGKMDLIAGPYAWEFDDYYESLFMDWPMFQHDAQHTGLYKQEMNDVKPPIVEIIKPAERCVYLMGDVLSKRFLFKNPVIIGKITVDTNAYDNESGVARVEFYIDDVLYENLSTQPYSWVWDDKTFSKHSLRVVVYDMAENSASDNITVWKFF